jgi:hypothetical protein
VGSQRATREMILTASLDKLQNMSLLKVQSVTMTHLLNELATRLVRIYHYGLEIHRNHLKEVHTEQIMLIYMYAAVDLTNHTN